MNSTEIQQEVVEIEAQLARLDQLESLLTVGGGKHAKFLRGELNRMANEIRRSYRKIDMRSPHATLEVNTAQATEAAYNAIAELVGQGIESLHSQKLELDKQLHILLNGDSEEPGESPTIGTRG